MVIGVYLAIIVANMGGHVDEIIKAKIKFECTEKVNNDPGFQRMSPNQRHEMIEQCLKMEMKQRGLDQPFLARSLHHLVDAITLSLGQAQVMTSDSGSREVRSIILERLPPTLLLVGTAQLLVFFIAIVVGLSLSQQYGSRLDKIVVALSPTSAAPGWFYGIFLILIFASAFRILPFGGMVDSPPPQESLAYALSVLKHLVLPLSALVLGGIFLSIYSWRTFFLIYSSEDYVEMAKAKGLPSGLIQRRYILRPTLPPIITDFAFAVIGMWQGSIILEQIFNWPGLGRLLFSAIGHYDTPVIIGGIVIYAYLLVFTLLFLDIIYALVDPRVSIGEGGTIE
jgi:peptide/nickel transport system permease protein